MTDSPEPTPTRLQGSGNPGSASLTCGSLILIALIVSFCSGGRRTSEIEGAIQRAQYSLRQLDSKIDALDEKVDRLVELLEKR